MKRVVTSAVLLLVAAAARAAVVAAPGWAVYTIPTGGTVQGGVVRSGDTILVGQGDFGAGMERIVRVEGGGPPITIATGFNSLGGFDLDAEGTLWVTDNCGDCAGAETGDTLFTIPDALTRTTPLAAVGQEVLPAGTIGNAFDALVLPRGVVLVSDAAGNGIGRVVRVSRGAGTDLITGLDLAGGIALAADGTLRVVSAFLNPDFSTTGEVLRYATDGSSQGTLIGGLQGGFGAAIDRDGNVLVSGVGSFGASRVITVAPGGTATDLATGFAFTGDIHFDAARNEALVLDFGIEDVTAICRDRDVDGVCDADDGCPETADAGQADTDGDGIGDACDVCAGVTVGKARLVLDRLATPPGDDALAFKGEMTVPTVPALDPVTNGVRVLVADGVHTVLDAVIPGGAFDEGTGVGWRLKKGAFRYRNDGGAIGGIVRVDLKPSATVPGLVRFAVTGRNGGYPVDPLDLPLHATLVLDAGAGQCGDAFFACTYKPKKGKVQCK